MLSRARSRIGLKKMTLHLPYARDLESSQALRNPRPMGNLLRGRSGLTDWQCRRVRAYVAENVGNPIKVSDLAMEARLSAGHFTRAFMIAFGVSPYSFVMAARVAKAKMLMTSSSCPLASIAEQCGLSDHAHFCRLFRRLEGLSPSEWRRQSSQKRAGARALV